MSDIIRFYKFVHPVDGKCWPWLGYIRYDGYGSFRFSGEKMGAHRVSYILHNGDIPEGMEVDHLCFNPCCVNPEHLQTVTPKNNKKRRKERILGKCRRGHPMTASNTIKRADNTQKCRKCTQDAQRTWVRKKRREKLLDMKTESV